MIIDVQLPDIDGFAVAAQLHRSTDLSAVASDLESSEPRLRRSCGDKSCARLHPEGRTFSESDRLDARRATLSNEMVDPRGSRGAEPRAVRIVLADDAVLLREGIASVLTVKGFEIVGQAGTAEELLLKVRSYTPDIAIVDIKMPPTHTDEGLRAARECRDLSRNSCARPLSICRRGVCPGAASGPHQKESATS